MGKTITVWRITASPTRPIPNRKNSTRLPLTSEDKRKARKDLAEDMPLFGSEDESMSKDDPQRQAMTNPRQRAVPFYSTEDGGGTYPIASARKEAFG